MSWDFIMPKKKIEERNREIERNKELQGLREEAERMKEERMLIAEKKKLRSEINLGKKEMRQEKHRTLYRIGGALKSAGHKIRVKGERIAASPDVGRLFDAGRINRNSQKSRRSDFMSGFDYWHAPPKKNPMKRFHRKRKRGGSPQVIIIRR